MINLRDYQSEALAAVTTSWDEGISRPVVVLPTGAGKTVCFSALIAERLPEMRKQGHRILVLAHREELLDQAEAKIKAMVPGVWTAIVKGSRGKTTHMHADVIVASVQTMARPKRREAIDKIGMLIVDECHRYASRTYREVLDHYAMVDGKPMPTVGFTATLTRMDGGLPEVWQSVAYQKKIHWMIKQGHLNPPRAMSIEVPGLNLASTRVTGGDLNTGDLSAALEDSQAFKVIAEKWSEVAADRPTIVFMPDVRTAEHMAEAFESVAGATAEVITGATPTSQRREAYERFASGATRALVSCMVLTEGFDAPQTSCVIIGRPTINPGLYIQMVGRGLRLFPGKDDCLVLDIAGASLKHNLAGVNDLESDCEARCDCGCLSCGCNERCKCGIRKCGCRCIEQHEAKPKGCNCQGSDGCPCGCPGDLDGTGLDTCFCLPECECQGGGDQLVEEKEVGVDVLKKLVDVDILGTELAGSGYTWLKTSAGLDFLTIGQDKHLFVFPAPDGSGYFLGQVEGNPRKPVITRLDSGAVPAAEARTAAEAHAEASGYTYNDRKASWRRTAASEVQVRMLNGLGVRDLPEKLRKGDASDMISAAKVTRLLDPRFGKYVKTPG